MFEWDAMSQHYFHADGHVMPAAGVGAIWAEEAPAELQCQELARTVDDLQWLEGWMAVLSLNESQQAVLKLTATGRSVEHLLANIELGPDPYVIPWPECTVIDDRIVQVRALCEDIVEVTPSYNLSWLYITRCHEWEVEVSDRDVLFALVRYLADLPVQRSD